MNFLRFFTGISFNFIHELAFGFCFTLLAIAIPKAQGQDLMMELQEAGVRKADVHFLVDHSASEATVTASTSEISFQDLICPISGPYFDALISCENGFSMDDLPLNECLTSYPYFFAYFSDDQTTPDKLEVLECHEY